ncbi:MAG: histidine kinase [Dictyoglomus sp. NZ13-RE01]|nr:MAG: histidine kinase [Dictyoglomus sp. NZ13-RE01]
MKVQRSKIFLKNFALISILPVVIIIVFGFLSYVLIEQYIKNEINKNALTLLSQNKNNLELILNEVDYLYMIFGINKDTALRLRRILNANIYKLEDVLELESIKSILNSISYSKPYIYSIYVYFENSNQNFIVTPDGITKVDNYFDKDWFKNFKNNKSELIWIERRRINPYNFLENPIEVLTLYRKIKPAFSKVDEGVIVVNLYLNYIKNLLNLSTFFPEQVIFVLDENKNILCSNLDEDEKDLYSKYVKENKNYLITELKSDAYNISYLSIIPNKYLYNVPLKLLKLISILLLVFLIVALFTSYVIAKINYGSIKKIIDIINSATSNKSLPDVSLTPNDEYGYIMYNIVRNFIEQHYLKTKLQALELLALQSQMNPHFLFNTLELLYLKTLALTGEPNEITEMIENLATILKYSLSNPKTLISVKEEIENTKCYINIAKARYKDKFYVKWQYKESVLDKKIMKLLFQPLIENAIYHGIKPSERKCGIKIKIMEIDNNALKVVVIDNGIGMSREKLEEINFRLNSNNDFSEHIGLINTYERLRLIYNDNFSLKIWSKLGIGTVITIKVPLISS